MPLFILLLSIFFYLSAIKNSRANSVEGGECNIPSIIILFLFERSKVDQKLTF